MEQYSEQDLRYAAEFRESIHQEALEIIRKTRPELTEVIDRHPVEDYFQQHWDYPGRWYTVVAIPEGYPSRKAFVNAIVRNTLSKPGPAEQAGGASRDAARPEQGRRRLTNQLDGRPEGYRELFKVELDQKRRSFRAVGLDGEGRLILEHYEEYSLGGATGSAGAYYLLTDAEYRRYARLALVNGQLGQEQYDGLATPTMHREQWEEDPCCALIAEYPDCGVDYCILTLGARYLGYESHRAALKAAWKRCFVPDEDEIDGGSWQGNPNLATGKRIPADALFSSGSRDGKLNYRRAFLYPPQENPYTGKDFVRVNAALFPGGAAALEVYRWSTDWTDYFDEGHGWGTLCLTVYDKQLQRFVVIMASARN